MQELSICNDLVMFGEATNENTGIDWSTETITLILLRPFSMTYDKTMYSVMIMPF